MDLRKFNDMSEQDFLDNFNKMNPDIEKNLSDDDKKFMKVHQATALIESMNSIDIKIHNLVQLARKVFPDADIETIKIISARMDDLDPTKVETLSLGFIKNLLTVEDKEYKMVIPDEVKKSFGDIDIAQIPLLDQMRTMILAMKSSSEDIAKCNEWKKTFQKVFDEKVDPDVKEIISTPDNIEKYTYEYYNKKLESPNVPEKEKEAIRKTLEYTDYGYNLKPLIDSLEAQIKKQKGDVGSLMYGFRHNAKDMMVTANKILAANRLTFPVAALSNIERALFGDKYSEYKYLTIYILARWIKYRGNSIDTYDKVFISQFISNIVRISRAKTDDEKKKCSYIIEKTKPNIEKLLRLIVDRV